jgi:hypothetical protein
VLDSRTLVRLSRRDPEIMTRMRKVAKARREVDTGKLARETPRKARARQAEKESEKA